jgi:integrase
VDGRLNGERIHTSLDTRDSQKAQRIVREWEANGQRTNDFEAAKPIAVEDAWKSFLADLQSRNLRISTIRKHKLLSRQMQEFALRRGIRFLKEFDLAALREFRVEWRDGPLSSTKKLERLRAFFRFSQENKWVEANPALKLKAPRTSQRPTLPFSHEETVRIVAALDLYLEQSGPRVKNSARRLRGLVLLLRYGGLRIGDAVKLTTDRINGNKLFLYTQKTGVPVFTILPDFVVRALDTIPPVTPTHLFWSGVDDLDGVVSSWRKRLSKLFKLANIPDGHAHRFRDTFATELLLAGVPIERVSRLLGHQSVRITEKYYAPWTESRQRQIEADLQMAWERDPVVLLQKTVTPELRGRNVAVN